MTVWYSAKWKTGNTCVTEITDIYYRKRVSSMAEEMLPKKKKADNNIS